MDGKWNVLDDELRKVIELDPGEIKLSNGVATFKRPKQLWFYNDQKMVLHKETLETLTDIRISVSHLSQDDFGEIIVVCSVEDMNETENRRSEFREFVEISALINKDGPMEFGTVIDLSKSGAKLEIDEGFSVKVGDVFSIRFSGEESEEYRRGLVRWVLLKEDKIHIGMKFYQ